MASQLTLFSITFTHTSTFRANFSAEKRLSWLKRSRRQLKQLLSNKTRLHFVFTPSSSTDRQLHSFLTLRIHREKFSPNYSSSLLKTPDKEHKAFGPSRLPSNTSFSECSNSKFDDAMIWTECAPLGLVRVISREAGETRKRAVLLEHTQLAATPWSWGTADWETLSPLLVTLRGSGMEQGGITKRDCGLGLFISCNAPQEKKKK